jgi:signal transduction histidine kinase
MWARFRVGSIQRQLMLLAIGPVLLVAILGAISEGLFIQDPESESRARVVAIQIEMVLDLVRSSKASEDRAAILRTVGATGLEVEEVSVAELQGTEPEAELGDFGSLVKEALSPALVAKLHTTTATRHVEQVLVVGVDKHRALAFHVRPPASPDSLITDRRVTGLLITMAIFAPVILLSLYGSRMIASPLLTFSRAARDLDPDGGPERPFEEMGSLEVRALARSLNDMRSRVRVMIEARTRMLRAISHDLRTPLTRLRLRAERSDQPSLRSALLTDIDALTFMIEETLVYLRNDMSSEDLLKADLPSMFMTACDDFADMGHSVTYHGPERFTYSCKPHALQRAIANLIDNGTKFAQHVNVELRIAEDRAVIIRIADDGPGIPPEFQANVLEPFFKLDSARGERGGFGLGLSIVQDIVQAHRGTMTLDNATPHGLIVEIRLPPAE